MCMVMHGLLMSMEPSTHLMEMSLSTKVKVLSTFNFSETTISICFSTYMVKSQKMSKLNAFSSDQLNNLLQRAVPLGSLVQVTQSNGFLITM